jgi:glycosyltransferase involved in cell wall biosynthesis
MRTVAVVPTYQNARTLPEVLQSLEAEGFHLIAVDDGSTDGTGEFLAQWISADPARRHAVQLPRNLGKGAALEAGLAAALQRGFARAVTVDADGQHRAIDARRVADAATDGLVVGAREEQAPGYPARSLFGRRLWALGVRSLTGLGVADPICGLRAYPLECLDRIRCRSGRFGWEEEWMVRAAWSGVIVRQVEIATIYKPPHERVSHWAWHDWPRNIGTWAMLAASRIIAMRGPLVPAHDQPLRGIDRSARMLAVMTFAVAACTGAASARWGSTGLAIACAALVALAFRLHASRPLTVVAAVLGWLAFH